MFLKTVSTDVLILGSEGAGARAAIEARKANAEVIVLTKGYQGRSGATVCAPGDYACESCCLEQLGVQGGDSRDSVEIFFNDIMAGGQYLNEPSLAERLAADSSRRLSDLINFGVNFTLAHHYSGHSYPRGAVVGKVGLTGTSIMRALGREARRCGAKLMQACFALEVLTKDGKVCGVIAWDIENGGLILFKAPAVIICTGGASRIWGRTSNPEEQTGDGLAMAYRVGAEIIDVEMVQFIPYALLYPPSAAGNPYYAIELISLLGAYLRNNKGERFMHRYDPGRMENTTRDFLSFGIASEVSAGRGSSHNGVTVDLSHVSKKEYEQFVDKMYPNWKIGAFSLDKFDFDPYKDSMEIGPVAHYHNGGIRIDLQCSTNVPGLYAAGESAGGIQGANRLSGCALTETQVFGAIAGAEAARYALGLKARPEPLSDESNPAKEFVSALLARRTKKRSVWELRRDIHELADNYVGVLRDKNGLHHAEFKLQNLRKELVTSLALDTHDLSVNKELVAVFETINMINVLEIVVQAALKREESIGSHYRLDFPEKSDSNINTIVFRETAGPKVVTKVRK